MKNLMNLTEEEFDYIKKCQKNSKKKGNLIVYYCLLIIGTSIGTSFLLQGFAEEYILKEVLTLLIIVIFLSGVIMLYRVKSQNTIEKELLVSNFREIKEIERIREEEELKKKKEK